MNLTDLNEMVIEAAQDTGRLQRLNVEIDEFIAKRFPQDAVDVQIEEQEAWEEVEYQALLESHEDKWGVRES